MKQFLSKLHTIKCNDSIEFRLRFHKKWLKYIEHPTLNNKADLEQMMEGYNQYIENINKRISR
ncbi:hypothetical protein P3875_07085 [Myroides sp. JBRI-B21084]|uniref:hypothetical protein n=1 Tax=Myroides sp. JBRI-B21084 TaxID=3119977 RepID=UPI0026E143CA|nr:hypothetical protein [Paenimyroides cloacae]WKW45550.1 hypothetical protein P3875_07085 [Paenimyroides cloacae]